ATCHDPAGLIARPFFGPHIIIPDAPWEIRDGPIRRRVAHQIPDAAIAGPYDRTAAPIVSIMVMNGRLTVINACFRGA
ncbi:MAG: hypothetical protein WAU86_12530, partial [Oricola sp.]